MNGQATPVWDLPLRLSHWSMTLAVPALWWTAENGEMGWHMRIGLFLLAVLVFRVLWGFLGTRTARFTSFLKGPAAVWRYVRGEAQPAVQIGHNPIGGWSVIALVGLMLVQVALGLFAGDPFDGATGPLNDKVGVMTADWMTDWHAILFDVLLGFIALHLAAIVFYWVARRRNLVMPMVTGKRAVANSEGNSPVNVPRFTICLVLAVALVLWLEAGAPGTG